MGILDDLEEWEDPGKVPIEIRKLRWRVGHEKAREAGRKRQAGDWTRPEPSMPKIKLRDE
jgi:hypothetical protein